MNDTQKDKFQFVEYSAEAAERIGYSDYSYWKSVFQNFFKKKSAVVMAGVILRPGDIFLYCLKDRQV